MHEKLTRYQIAVLNSLYRIERQGNKILCGVAELLNEGPNDQNLKEELRKLATDLEKDTLAAQKAIEEAVAETKT